MSTIRAAKTIYDLRDGKLSNLPLQKLLYLSHLIHLGTNGRPLASREFEAWALGPVEPDLYHALKAYGSKQFPDIFHAEPYPHETPERTSIEKVMHDVGAASPGKLVAITHWTGGAWAHHYRPNVPGIRIPDSEVLKEYQRIVERSELSRQSA